MGLADDDLKRRVREYQAFLNSLGGDGRRDFVDVARRGEDWPRPQENTCATTPRSGDEA